MFHVAEYRGPDADDALSANWAEWLEETPDASFLQAFPLLQTLDRSTPRRHTMRYYVVSLAGKTVGALALHVRFRSNWLGTVRELTDATNGWSLCAGPVGKNRAATMFAVARSLTESDRDWDRIALNAIDAEIDAGRIETAFRCCHRKPRSAHRPAAIQFSLENLAPARPVLPPGIEFHRVRGGAMVRSPALALAGNFERGWPAAGETEELRTASTHRTRRATTLRFARPALETRFDALNHEQEAEAEFSMTAERWLNRLTFAAGSDPSLWRWQVARPSAERTGLALMRTAIREELADIAVLTRDGEPVVWAMGGHWKGRVDHLAWGAAATSDQSLYPLLGKALLADSQARGDRRIDAPAACADWLSPLGGGFATAGCLSLPRGVSLSGRWAHWCSPGDHC